MFRDMRRIRQLMSKEDAEKLLLEGTSGVLGVNGDDGYPYTVPVSYVYENDKIYFHGAKSGHKIDSIRNNDKVSFCVIGYEQNVPEEFTAYYKSVVAFGRAVILEDDVEKREAVVKIAKRFSPDELEEKMNEAIEREWAPLAVFRIDIEHMTGKQARELIGK